MNSSSMPAAPRPDWDPKTLIVAGGRPAHDTDAPVNYPVTFTSTYHSQGQAAVDERVYARFSNPTWDPFEEVLGQLEVAALPALVFSSGMAAIAAALSLVPAGGVLVMPKHSYNGSLALSSELQAAGRLDIRPVDIADTEEVITALEGADVLWVESPTNPMLEVADLPVLLEEAKNRGVLSIVDNTFATPLLQRPLTSGADLVVHSVTKYLSGHSDIIMGALVTSDESLRQKLHGYRTLHGAISSPMDTYLALRGVRTMAVRIDRSQANSQVLAERLAVHPKVQAVRYPGLGQDPGHERAARLMDGFGSVIAFQAGQNAEDADQVVAGFNLITGATSLGGVETLAERRARHASEPETVPDNLIRLSVGIEDVEDLWSDVKQALEQL
ncbi:aminotransferase class I/II-fold pyridoxal phosphate-dependent enzyme [Glutamicibacter sp. JL.03c]|uniref:trans-sulfuration enzyme family protein n=1 Tax=Glutamicibacter sp. JL.03c TaxID=2984842 RepID=UPI0021F74B13|nr:aminotransferase class I/II-fold pyridoxal phosphate-dependent enzyme [Glutamicibacter sp. JL.03c]UYQ78090.1 aminotransferase class I/II-fold pyridoxal phosphate-dependent enzyme [Glutamicibacter sp. JL.03c]